MQKNEIDIEGSLKIWQETEHHPDERDASFDYCYNYFRGFSKTSERIKMLADKENLQMSCLQLGFYLASWGMLRGSSFLLQKSAKHYIPLINAISEMKPKLWEIDVDNYKDEENLNLLMKCSEEIKVTLGAKAALEDGKGKIPSETLVTKIMLGVFANVPAYDTYFKIFLRDQKMVQTFNMDSLKSIGEYYSANKEKIKRFEVPTYYFSGDPNKDIFYTKAKLVDIVGFKYGLKTIGAK